MKSQALRFVLVGCINTGLTYVLFVLFAPVLGRSLAYSITYVGGVGFSYFANSLAVFRTKIAWRTAFKYPLVYIVQYIYGLIALSLLVDGLAIRNERAILIVIATSVPINFVLVRLVLRGGGVLSWRR